MQEETRYALANQEKVNKALELMIGDRNVTWQKLLSPAPMGIAILGQLMIVAANQQDFPIDHGRDQFNLIKHPESFRASLLDISNQGYTAFGKAHNNMEQIRLMTQQVPSHVTDVAKILLSGNQSAIDKILPRRLKRIQDAAVESLNLSKEVADAFTQLGDLISQVIVAASLSKSQNEKVVKDKDHLLKLEEEKQKKLKEELERKNQDMERLRERERMENVNRQRAFEAANKSVGLFERITSWLTGDNIDANRRSQAKELLAETNAQMDKVKAEARQTEQEMKKINDEFLTSLHNMQVTNVNSLSAEKAIKLLREGLQKLGELKGHWSQLTNYFQSINNIINRVTNPSLNQLKEDAEEAAKDRTLLEIVADSTLQSNQHSYLTYRIADMYVNVSGRYIMGSVARLGKMIAASDNIEEAQRELMDSCKEAADGITAMVIESKEKMVRDMDQRQSELQELNQRFTLE